LTLVWSIGEQERTSFRAAGSTVPRCSRDGANDISASEDPDRPVIGTHHR
jgi:hypothetical protein